MSWLRDLLLMESAKKKARARRDEGGNPICGGCRNNVDEHARVCEHCGAELESPRKVGIVGVIFVGVGIGGGLFGLVLVLGALAVLSQSPIGGGGLLVTGGSAIALSVAYRLKKERPVRELKLRSRVPSFALTLAKRAKNLL